MNTDPNSVLSNQSDEVSPPAPRFDARASASAQPVEPIHSNGEPVHKSIVASWRQRLHSLNGRIGPQSRALAIVVIIGLVTGAMGGVLLVNAARTTQRAAESNSAVSEEVSELSAPETQKLDDFAAALGGAKVERSGTVSTRPGKSRGRSRSSKPRAYRVAIIR